jgi:hypothetical protein
MPPPGVLAPDPTLADDIARLLALAGEEKLPPETEPLPADHLIWTHPKAIVTPHLASLPTRRERAEHVARAIAAHERGEALRNLYDHDRGY